jgi:hypothetical protein
MSEENKRAKSSEGSVTSIKYQESVTPVDMTPEYVPLTKEAREQRRIQNEVALRKLWEKDREVVRGIFRYHECPGGMLSFPFYKYKWDEMKTYSLNDGEVYEIPRAVAKHLNTNCSYPTYNYKNNVQGMPEVTVSERVRRTSFQSLEFVDMDDPSMKSKVVNSSASRSLSNSGMGSALPN